MLGSEAPEKIPKRKVNRTKVFCHLCPTLKGFAQRSNLERHLLNQHDGAQLPNVPAEAVPSEIENVSVSVPASLPEPETSKKGRKRRAFFSLPTAPKAKRTRSTADTEKQKGKCVPPE